MLELQLKDKEPRIVGFFNMFELNSTRFHEIIHEQVSFIDSSGILGRADSIQYLYFGPNHNSYTIPSASPKYVKSNRSSSAGGEADALELLHEHCALNPGDRVFYIHSKGSYHQWAENDLLRGNLMKAVAFCIQESDSLDWSDVCGLRVSPVPYPQFSGAGPPHGGISSMPALDYSTRCGLRAATPPGIGLFLPTAIDSRRRRRRPARRQHVARPLRPRRAAPAAKALPSPDGPRPAAPRLPRLRARLRPLRLRVLGPLAPRRRGVAAVDVLPLRATDGRPIAYAWAYYHLPAPDAWQPSLAHFPRPGMTPGLLLPKHYADMVRRPAPPAPRGPSPVRGFPVRVAFPISSRAARPAGPPSPPGLSRRPGRPVAAGALLQRVLPRGTVPRRLRRAAAARLRPAARGPPLRLAATRRGRGRRGGGGAEPAPAGVLRRRAPVAAAELPPASRRPVSRPLISGRGSAPKGLERRAGGRELSRGQRFASPSTKGETHPSPNPSPGTPVELEGPLEETDGRDPRDGWPDAKSRAITRQWSRSTAIVTR